MEQEGGKPSLHSHPLMSRCRFSHCVAAGTTAPRAQENPGRQQHGSSSTFTARAGTSIGDQGEHSNMMPHYGPMDCFLISRASHLLLSNGLQEEEEEEEEV